MAACFAEAGAKVALVARRPEALEQAQAEIAAKAKGKVEAFPCDVTDPQQIEALFPKIESTLGPVDILVNNAGSSARAPFLEITDAMWQADLDLKLFAAIRLCQIGRAHV